MIQQAPEDLTVTSGTQAKFVCTALTDPDEAQVGNGRQKSVDYKYLSYFNSAKFQVLEVLALLGIYWLFAKSVAINTSLFIENF